MRPEPARLWRARRLPNLAADIKGGGQAVVLLHGQPGSAGDWAGVAEELAGEHTVIVPDRLGYGRTGGRAAGFSANAVALSRLLVALDVPDAVVVGHSWAGGVALQMALDFPHMVRALVLVSSVSPDVPVGRLDHILARRVVGTAVVAVTLSTAGSLLAWGPGRAYVGRRLAGRRRQDVSEVARLWRRPATWASFATEQRALLHELPAMAGRLAGIAAPAVVLVGSSDRVVAPATGRHLADAIPRASLHQVEGAGHLLPQARPGEVANAVRRAAAL